MAEEIDIPTIIQKKKKVLKYVFLVILVVNIYTSLIVWASPRMKQGKDALDNRPECTSGLEALHRMVGAEWVSFALFLLFTWVPIARMNHHGGCSTARRLEYVWRMAAIVGVLFLTLSIVTNSVVLVVQTRLLTCGSYHAGFAARALYGSLTQSASLVFFWVYSYRLGHWDADYQSGLELFHRYQSV